MIQAVDVNRAEPWGNGPDRQADKRYLSDLADEEWEQFATRMPNPLNRHRG